MLSSYRKCEVMRNIQHNVKRFGKLVTDKKKTIWISDISNSLLFKALNRVHCRPTFKCWDNALCNICVSDWIIILYECVVLLEMENADMNSLSRISIFIVAFYYNLAYELENAIVFIFKIDAYSTSD